MQYDGLDAGEVGLDGIGSLLAAKPGTALIREGWLMKSDPYGSSWKKRWCVLMPTSFCYYETADKRDASLKGAFELRNAKLIPGWTLNKKSPTPWLCQLQLSSRHYYFCCGSQGELTEWLLDIDRVLAALQNRPLDAGLGGGGADLTGGDQLGGDAGAGVGLELDYGIYPGPEGHGHYSPGAARGGDRSGVPGFGMQQQQQQQQRPGAGSSFQQQMQHIQQQYTQQQQQNPPYGGGRPGLAPDTYTGGGKPVWGAGLASSESSPLGAPGSSSARSYYSSNNGGAGGPRPAVVASISQLQAHQQHLLLATAAAHHAERNAPLSVPLSSRSQQQQRVSPQLQQGHQLQLVQQQQQQHGPSWGPAAQQQQQQQHGYSGSIGAVSSSGNVGVGAVNSRSPVNALLSTPAANVNLDNSFANAAAAGNAPSGPQSTPLHGAAADDVDSSSVVSSAAKLVHAPPPPMEDENITFYVVTGGAEGLPGASPEKGGAEWSGAGAGAPSAPVRTWTMMAKKSTLGALTMAKLKKRLGKATGIADTSIMTLTVDGDDTVLADDWNADDINLADGGTLRVHFTSPPSGSSGSASSSSSLSSPPQHGSSASAGDGLWTMGGVVDSTSTPVGAPPHKRRGGRGGKNRGPPPPAIPPPAVAAEQQGEGNAGAGGGVPSITASGIRRSSTLAATAADAADAAAAGVDRAEDSSVSPTSTSLGLVEGVILPSQRSSATPGSSNGQRTPASISTSATAAAVNVASATRGGGGQTPSVALYSRPAGVLFTPTAPSSSASSSLPAALDRRLRLRQLFMAIAGDPFSSPSALHGGDSSAAAGAVQVAIDRADYAGALASDPDVCMFPEYEPIIRKLMTVPQTGSSWGHDSLSITWDQFCDMLRDISSSAATASAASATAAAAAAGRRAASPAGALEPSPSAATAASSGVAGNGTHTPPPGTRSTRSSPLLPPPSVMSAVVIGSANDSASATGAGGGSPSESSKRQRHVMVMTIDLADGVSEELHITASDDAEALAAQFVESHGLPPADFLKPLAEEIQKSVLAAYALELTDARETAAAAEASVVRLEAQLATAQADLRSLKHAAEASAAAAAAAEREYAARELAALERASTAEADAEDARARLSALGAALQTAREQCESARRESAAAADEISALRGQIEALQVQAEDAARRSAAWDRAVGGGLGVGVRSALMGAVANMAATSTSTAATPLSNGSAPGHAAAHLSHQQQQATAAAAAAAHKGEWRAWAEEKRALLARSNADRALLVEENKRLRASLDVRGIEAEERLRAADEAAAAAAAETHTLAVTRDRVEAELRAVYLQWREEARRWGEEKRAMLDHLEGGSSSVARDSTRAHPSSLRSTLATTTTSGAGVGTGEGNFNLASGDVASLSAASTMAKPARNQWESTPMVKPEL